jgi:deoxyribonuclease-4
MRIGFHVPLQGGLLRALKAARQRRCTTLQLFASAPVQWALRAVDPDEDRAFVEARQAHDLNPLFIHAPYLINLASLDPDLWAKSCQRLAGDLHRAEAWQAAGVVVHSGSGGTNLTPRQARRRVATALRQILAATAPPTTLILENCAGQGNIVGVSPEELGEIIDLAGGQRLQVCLDTAHALAAGFALHTPEGLADLLDRCEASFGLDRLALIHANDSQAALGSQRDRHAHLGQGHIGREGWRVIMSEPRLQALPFIMETPKTKGHELTDDLRNLRALRRAIPPALRPPLPPPLDEP